MTMQITTAKLEQCCHWVVSCRVKGKRHWYPCHVQWSAACDCVIFTSVCLAGSIVTPHSQSYHRPLLNRRLGGYGHLQSTVQTVHRYDDS